MIFHYAGSGPIGQELFPYVLEEFVAGAYGGDTSSHKLPAMNFMQALLCLFGWSENKTLWQTVGFLSPHSEPAKQAIQCLEKLTFTTEIDAISKATWLTPYSNILFS